MTYRVKFDRENPRGLVRAGQQSVSFGETQGGGGTPTVTPPVANPDTFTVLVGSGPKIVYPLGNDDFGNSTLTIQSAVILSGPGAVAYDATSVAFTEAGAGETVVRYTVVNAEGATAFSTITFNTVASTAPLVQISGSQISVTRTQGDGGSTQQMRYATGENGPWTVVSMGAKTQAFTPPTTDETYYIQTRTDYGTWTDSARISRDTVQPNTTVVIQNGVHRYPDGKSVRIRVNRNSGMAPYVVYAIPEVSGFDCDNPTADLYFRWKNGDPNSPQFQSLTRRTSEWWGNRSDWAFGRYIAIPYFNPGVYFLEVEVTDDFWGNNWYSATIQINIEDRNAVVGDEIYYVSKTSAGLADAPVGAKTAVASTFDAAFGNTGSANRMILLKRDEAYLWTDKISSGNNARVVVSDWGDGQLPKVQTEPGNPHFDKGKFSDMLLERINWVGTWDNMTNTDSRGLATGHINTLPFGENVKTVCHQCIFEKAGSCSWTLTKYSSKWHTETTHAILDCTVRDWRLAAFFTIGCPYYAIIGSRFYQQQGHIMEFSHDKGVDGNQDVWGIMREGTSYEGFWHYWGVNEMYSCTGYGYKGVWPNAWPMLRYANSKEQGNRGTFDRIFFEGGGDLGIGKGGSSGKEDSHHDVLADKIVYVRNGTSGIVGTPHSRGYTYRNYYVIDAPGEQWTGSHTKSLFNTNPTPNAYSPDLGKDVPGLAAEIKKNRNIACGITGVSWLRPSDYEISSTGLSTPEFKADGDMYGSGIIYHAPFHPTPKLVPGLTMGSEPLWDGAYLAVMRFAQDSTPFQDREEFATPETFIGRNVAAGTVVGYMPIKHEKWGAVTGYAGDDPRFAISASGEITIASGAVFNAPSKRTVTFPNGVDTKQVTVDVKLTVTVTFENGTETYRRYYAITDDFTQPVVTMALPTATSPRVDPATHRVPFDDILCRFRADQIAARGDTLPFAGCFEPAVM